MTRTLPATQRARHARRPERAARRRIWPALVVAGLLLGAAGGWLVHSTLVGDEPVDRVAAARDSAERFLDTYVETSGRVVRRDQGSDSVSEGQAYGMLLAVAVGDAGRFRAVWGWTRTNLQRPDGLLAWRWPGGTPDADGDANSAADADLDAARALVLAGERFGDPGLTSDGAALAAAVLEVETAPVGTDLLPAGAPAPNPGSAVSGVGRVLTGGNWTAGGPRAVNPGYFSPRADLLLGRAGDPRWAQLSRTQRAISWQLIGTGLLPPDWAVVDDAGGARPTPTPGADGARYGLDAARVPIRMAESCDPADRAVAAELAPRLDADQADAGARELSGSATVSWEHPLPLVAAAAAADAAGDASRSGQLLDAADELEARHPTYYGAAWVALGRVMLDTDLLGGCG